MLFVDRRRVPSLKQLLFLEMKFPNGTDGGVL
jgi:hypothetical protein